MYAAGEDGTIHIFDVRVPHAVGTAQHLRTRLAGAVLVMRGEVGRGSVGGGVCVSDVEICHRVA